MARLNRQEFQIINGLIRSVIGSRRAYWRDLQDDILSFGYQDWYLAQAPFDDAVNALLGHLEPETLGTLLDLASKRGMDKEQGLRFYRVEMIERIVRRAESSGLRRL